MERSLFDKRPESLIGSVPSPKEDNPTRTKDDLLAGGMKLYFKPQSKNMYRIIITYIKKYATVRIIPFTL